MNLRSLNRWRCHAGSAMLVWMSITAFTPVAPAQCPHLPQTHEEVLRLEARSCIKAGSSDALCPAGKSREKSYSLVKDCGAEKPDAYLVIPPAVVTGIESTALAEKQYNHLWSDAWEWSRRFPRADPSWTAIAVNSKDGRTIDQLHVHISCVSDAVRNTIAANNGHIPQFRPDASDTPDTFYTVAVPLKDPDTKKVTCNRYRAVKVSSLSGKSNPLTVVTALVPGHAMLPTTDMAIVGSAKANQYFILTYESGDNKGFAEGMLDQTCRQAVAAGAGHVGAEDVAAHSPQGDELECTLRDGNPTR